MRVHLPVLLGHILGGNASFSSPARISFCVAGKMGRKNGMAPSWSGDQTFLDETACLRLLVLLLEIFPDYGGQV